MVCAGAYAPAHTIFALPFYEGLSSYKKSTSEEEYVQSWKRFNTIEN
jgi:hypothetical protein